MWSKPLKTSNRTYVTRSEIRKGTNWVFDYSNWLVRTQKDPEGFNHRKMWILKWKVCDIGGGLLKTPFRKADGGGRDGLSWVLKGTAEKYTSRLPNFAIK